MTEPEVQRRIFDYAVVQIIKVVDGDTVDMRIETDWRGETMHDNDLLLKETPWEDGGFHIEVKSRVWARIVDGNITLGVNLKRRTAHRFRLLDIDTPERGQGNWAEATAFTRSWLARPNLRCRTEKGDAFGRWLARVYDPSTGEDLDDALLAAGLAKVYIGVSMM